MTVAISDPREPPCVCAFDQTQHANLQDLHAHIRRFKVSQKLYYETYWPRKDLLTGEIIPFKDIDRYFSQDFVSKVTLKKWLAKNPAEGMEWAKRWLVRRKLEKELIYAPSQVELRTLCCPSMPYYETLGATEGGYYGITKRLGYVERYNLNPLVFNPLPSNFVIIQDSREQSPINLPRPVQVEALNVGDYALAAPYDVGVRIERKSLTDFCGTLSNRKVTHKGGCKGTEPIADSALQRFDRELARAEAANLYVVMMVESDINDVQRFNYLPQTRWIKASPEYVLHNLRTLLTKYPLTFQSLFVPGRIEMARVMVKVFELGKQIWATDLQHAYEESKL